MPFAVKLAPFYFLRHGVTDHNQRRLVMGQLDIPLNDLGRRQARSAARLVAGLGIGQVVSSPLVRARETAEIIASVLNLEVVIADGLKERDWGALSGRAYRDLMHATVLPADAETFDSFTVRILTALATVSAGPPPLVVAHSGMCRVLRRHLGIPDDHRSVPNAVPILFAPDAGGRWSEQVLADDPEAEALGHTPDLPDAGREPFSHR